MLDLIAAQAKRIDSQAGEIEKQWHELKKLHEEKCEAEGKAAECPSKYAQLKLEAYLGLWKVAIAAGAGVFVVCLVAALLAFHHKDLAELLKAARPDRLAGMVSAPAAVSSSASGVAGRASSAASTSTLKQVTPGTSP